MRRTRRTLLKSGISASLLGGLAVPAGADEDKQFWDGLTRTGEGFYLDSDDEIRFDGGTECEPATGAIVPHCSGAFFDRMEDAAADLREADAEGLVHTHEGNDTVMIEPTGLLREKLLPLGVNVEPMSAVEPADHGKTDYGFSREDWIGGVDAYSVNIWLDDEDTETATKMYAAGAAASEIAAGIIGLTGWGIIPAAVVAGFGALLAYHSVDFATTNDGHGVKVECYIQAYLPVPTYDMFPQPTDG